METMQLLKRTPTEDLRNHIYYGYLLLFQRLQSSKLWELTVGQNLTAPCFVALSIIITTRNSQVVIRPERTTGCKEEIDHVLFQVLGISDEIYIPCVANWHLSHSSVFSKRTFMDVSKSKKEEISELHFWASFKKHKKLQTLVLLWPFFGSSVEVDICFNILMISKLKFA